MKQKRLMLPKGVSRKDIADYCGVCECTVSEALNFRTQGEQPDRIRKVAKEIFKCTLIKF